MRVKAAAEHCKAFSCMPKCACQLAEVLAICMPKRACQLAEVFAVCEGERSS